MIIVHTGKPRKPRKSGRKKFNRSPPLSVAGLHRFLWKCADHRGYVVFSNAWIAQRFEVSLDRAEGVVKQMRQEGRVRFVRHNAEHKRVNQIADPARWKADDPSTHARPGREATWG